MRYENWDVLLFPEDSRVPIQEFKTQCFVTKDRESPYLHSPSLLNPSAYYPGQSTVAQLPVLTTFIPSLPHNTAFRVSVHSWEKPRPSRTMESLMQPDDSVLYEVRIFIDGLCVAGSIFGQRTAWPHVIDLSSHIDKNGNQDNLRFPPFHQEILQQSHWDAAELHGRIRVVIAEGFSRPHRSPPFERVKDIIAFSFQHAPLHILEYSNIAWPNAGMWYQAPRNLFKYHSASGLGDHKDTEDAHAHSPTRHENRTSGTGSSLNSSQAMYSAWPYRLFPPPLAQWQNDPREPRWPAPNPPMPDPFVEPFVEHGPHRRSRSTLEDVPMPDYVGSSSTSSRAISNMTGISFEHSKQPSFTAPIDDEQYNQLIEAFSPSKEPAGGTHAPTNTPSSVPPLATKPSAAAEARSASYSKSGSRPPVLKEVSQPGTRNVSGSSAKSGPPVDGIVGAAAARKVHVTPNSGIKGKKEGKGVQDNKENEATSESSSREVSRASNVQPKVVVRSGGSVMVSNEPKRRRSGGLALGETVQLAKEETIVLSPTTRGSESEEQENEQQDGFEEFLEAQMQIGGNGTEIGDVIE